MATIPSVDQRFTTDTTPLLMWWFINGTLIDFSTGYTFEGKLYRADDENQTVIFDKTDGFTGAQGSGTRGEDGAVANLSVAWDTTTGDFRTAGISDGTHVFQVTATLTADGSQSVTEVLIPLKVPV